MFWVLALKHLLEMETVTEGVTQTTMGRVHLIPVVKAMVADSTLVMLVIMDRVTVEIRDLMEVLVLDQLKPEMVTETQETDRQKLETEMEAPGTDLMKPETEMEAPETDLLKPETGTEAPGTDHQKLETEMETPETDHQKLETEMETPGTDHQKLVMVMVATEMVAETVAETNPWKNQAVVK
jgi:hypothetical protein